MSRVLIFSCSCVCPCTWSSTVLFVFQVLECISTWRVFCWKRQHWWHREGSTWCMFIIFNQLFCKFLYKVQGSGRSWKIMEFKIYIFQAWKVMESCLGFGKSWKIMWRVMENEQLWITNLQPDIKKFNLMLNCRKIVKESFVAPKSIWHPARIPLGELTGYFTKQMLNRQWKVMENSWECSVGTM